jgi:hypothetical protein
MAADVTNLDMTLGVLRFQARAAELRAQALLLVGIILAVVGVVNEAYVNELTN